MRTTLTVEPSTAPENLWAYAARTRPEIERALARHLPLAPAYVDNMFNEAVRYALFPGGKRLRPVLTMLGAEAAGGEISDLLPAAAAVEYVHTSSLIFDDLPCMDDAHERRGQAALHLRYGEGLAVLVALALMNSSYGLMFQTPPARGELAIRAHAELVECIGAQGMVAGQVIDLSATAVPFKPSRVPRAAEVSRNLKTSALMRCALRLGAILSGAGERRLETLSRFAELLGEAYQLSDDLLDLAEDAALCGGGTRLATLPLERGPSQTQQRIDALLAEAKEVLEAEFGTTPPVRLLQELADYIADRKD